VKLTAKELTEQEDAILDALEHTPSDRRFLGMLYRDGVPTPASYLAQPVRVLFVFREPNMRGDPYALDMRDQLRNEQFRPLRNGVREKDRPRGWWNNRVGMFAHAVAAALDGESPSFDDFRAVIDRGDWNHEIVNRFAYIQIKKIGGAGAHNAAEICAYAEKYRKTLKDQVDLYRPHMIIGCGIGRASPARLLSLHVFLGQGEKAKSESGSLWWQFAASSRPIAMLEIYHPSARGSRSDLYHCVWSSVREVARVIGIGLTV
jgi:hypothetical protein